MSDPIIPSDAKVYGAASIAVLIVTAAIREWFKARNGKSGLLSGMAIVQAEDLAATTSIRKQLQEENERMSKQLGEMYVNMDRLRDRAINAEEALAAFLSQTRDCPTPEDQCPARRIHDERRNRSTSGKFGPLREESEG